MMRAENAVRLRMHTGADTTQIRAESSGGFAEPKATWQFSLQCQCAETFLYKKRVIDSIRILRLKDALFQGKLATLEHEAKSSQAQKLHLIIKNGYYQ